MAAIEVETPSEVRKLAEALGAVNLGSETTVATVVSDAVISATNDVEASAANVPVDKGNLNLPEINEQAGRINLQPLVDKPKSVMVSGSPVLSVLQKVVEASPAATTPIPSIREQQGAMLIRNSAIEDTPVDSDDPQGPPYKAKQVPSPSPKAAATTAPAPAAPTSHIAVDSEIHAEPEPIAAPAAVETAAGDSPAMPAPAADSVKTLPTVAAEAARQAGQAYLDAGKQAQLTLKDLLSLREKEGPPVTLSVDQIATAVFLLWIGLQLLILPIFLPSTFRLLYSLSCGLLVGLCLSYLFYKNRRRKTEANELLATDLGLKGVQFVTGGVPAIFNVSDTEKMEWLNALVKEMWPFVDKGVCNMIKEMTAQTMPGILQSMPSTLSGIVRSVGFKHLTFGSMPVRVESIRVHRENDGLGLELFVKWCGDPNITLAIEIPGGQKLCPRVLDISFSATLRVLLRPLVPRLPGFVALMATVPKPPLIKYRLDFGKAMGGSMAPAAVTPVINFFVKGVLDRMLVWPNRIVVPILQETPHDAAEVQKLMRRVRGMVRVCVVRGKKLKGVAPLENAVVELTTDTEYREATPPRAAVSPEELQAVDGKLDRLGNKEIITWAHFIYLLLQEPESQMLRVEAFEMTPARSKDAQSTRRRVVGRALVKLNRVCKAGMEGSREQMPVTVQLGENDWGSPGGPGKGAGSIRLHITYFPCEEFTKEQVLGAKKGILTVRLLAIGGLSPGINSNVTAWASYNLTSHKKDHQPSYRTARRMWTLAGHVAQLKAQLKKLEIGRERDLREGNTAAAEAKEAEMRALQTEIDTAAEKNKTRMVTLDFSMETQSLHAFHNVTESLEDSNEENLLKIKVIQEGRLKRAAETLGMAEVPVSRIKNSYCLNPLSGKKEHGLYIQKWKDFDPEAPGHHPKESEWGLPVSGNATARVWMVARWVPHVEAAPLQLDEKDEAALGNALPSSIKADQSAWQVK